MENPKWDNIALSNGHFRSGTKWNHADTQIYMHNNVSVHMNVGKYTSDYTLST